MRLQREDTIDAQPESELCPSLHKQGNGILVARGEEGVKEKRKGKRLSYPGDGTVISGV